MSRIRNLTLGDKNSYSGSTDCSAIFFGSLAKPDGEPWASIDALMSRMRKTRSEKNSCSGSTDCGVIFFGSPAEPDWRDLDIY